MKPLVLTELEARYNKSKEDIMSYVREHASEFPQGSKYTKTYLFNIPLIEALDNAFNIHPEDEASQEETKIQLLTAKITDLKGQVNKLKESYQAKDKELTVSQNDLKDMEDKFLKFQDSASAGAKQMVDKLRNENEILKSQVANFNKLKAEQLAAKDDRINELKDLVAELEDIVKTNSNLSDEKMKFELKSKQLSEKYLQSQKTIENFSTERTNLENEILKLKESNTYTENEVTELQGTLNGLIKSIATLIGDAKLKLDGVDKTVTTIPEIKEKRELKEVHSVPAPATIDLDDETASDSAAVEETVASPAPENHETHEAFEIRQDEDETEGTDAATPFPGSF